MSFRALISSTAFLLAVNCAAQIQPNDTRPIGLNSVTTVVAQGSITGFVRNYEGQPISGARVMLRNIENPTAIASTTSAETGAFQISNVPPATYEISAMAGVNESRERIVASSSEEHVVLRLNAPTSDGTGSSTVSVASMQISDKARNEFEKAQKLMMKNKLAEAREKVEKALSISPKFAEALTLRGILQLSESPEAGMKDFQDAISIDPSYAMAFIAMGAALNNKGRYQDAERSLERGISLKPDAWQGYFELSKANMGLGDYKDALKYANRALEITSEYAPVHLVKANAFIGMRMYDEAILELETFLTREPEGPNSANARNALNQAKAFVQRGSK